MTSPWERLREAAQALASECDGLYVADVVSGGRGVSQQVIRDVEAARKKLVEALAALPATLPQQPSSDAERERAIEKWIRRIATARFDNDIVAFDKAVQDGCDLMRSAPAPQPGTITCKCGAVATLLPINCKSSVGWIGCAKCGHELMRWGPQPAEPVPAPPASDWRERFNAVGGPGDTEYTDYQEMRDRTQALRDGLAALEAEVARLKEEP